jgi:hypothetical protein
MADSTCLAAPPCDFAARGLLFAYPSPPVGAYDAPNLAEHVHEVGERTTRAMALPRFAPRGRLCRNGREKLTAIPYQHSDFGSGETEHRRGYHFVPFVAPETAAWQATVVASSL